MRTPILLTTSLYFLFTFYHALCLFTAEADDYREPSTIQLPTSGEPEERVRELLDQRRRNPAAIRYASRQCHHKQRRKEKIIESMIKEARLTGKERTNHDGPHQRSFESSHMARLPKEEEVGKSVMKMLKRPSPLTTCMRARRAAVSESEETTVCQEKEAAIAVKRKEEIEHKVIKKIRKFLGLF